MAHKAAAQESITITVRVPVKLRDRLESLANATKRSRSFLAADAIDKYVSAEEWQVAGIQQALDDERPGLPDNKVATWMKSLGTVKPLPRPRTPAGRKLRKRRS